MSPHRELLRSALPLYFVFTFQPIRVFLTGLYASLEVKREGHRIGIDGTDGAGLLPELHFLHSDTVLIKKRYSAFFRTELDAILDHHACKSIIVAGVNTHACVRATVVDAYQRDYDVWIARDCIDSYDEEHQAISMKYMDGKLAIAMTNDQLDAALRNSLNKPK